MSIICPVSLCRAENEAHAAVCVRCQTPLRSYVRLYSYPARLFNLGLAAARQGQLTQARDLFAAVVYWMPMDLEARNALALACFALNDAEAARQHWQTVLARSATDPIATQGRLLLAQRPAPLSQIRTKKKTGRKKAKR